MFCNLGLLSKTCYTESCPLFLATPEQESQKCVTWGKEKKDRAVADCSFQLKVKICIAQGHNQGSRKWGMCRRGTESKFHKLHYKVSTISFDLESNVILWNVGAAIFGALDASGQQAIWRCSIHLQQDFASAWTAKRTNTWLNDLLHLNPTENL